ncbi:protein methyltransferase HemK [Gordonia effusa NBRC 100432]|uniref:peptide chain release factor N(5)-glutamine methyltransferase n=1 Tax=Gordonia effusa NBRC 100432 TaxID=1077974 RepID=H0QVP9_9ACTN|nr:peptide chain release factor N(5)-glutamine methyltransferase [Gordonia effusa]GAB16900.1 protein methyltransferase HemK [Gordonia effusa NBRC 100432]
MIEATGNVTGASESVGGQPSSRRTDDQLAWATGLLHDAGVSSPLADAQWLLAHVADVDRGRLVIVDEIDAGAVAEFGRLVRARAARYPLQYLVGTAAFRTLELQVGNGVFIPRPETELLAEWAISVAPHGDCLIADFCSGSGALAISLATELPNARLVAIEESLPALMWLKRNVAAQPADVADRITVVHADVTRASDVAKWLAPASCDVVVANPPYVPEDTEVEPEVDIDPAEAVFAGFDGMSVINPMVPVLAKVCKAGGVVGIEHDDSTPDAVGARLADDGLFTAIAGHRDLAGRPRFVTATRVEG